MLGTEKKINIINSINCVLTRLFIFIFAIQQFQSEVENIPIAADSPEPLMPGKRKRRKDDEESSSIKRVAIEALEKSLNVMENHDMFTDFGNFVASQLRAIPDVNVAKRIQRTVNRCLLDNIDKYENELTVIK